MEEFGGNYFRIKDLSSFEFLFLFNLIEAVSFFNLKSKVLSGT